MVFTLLHCQRLQSIAWSTQLVLLRPLIFILENKRLSKTYQKKNVELKLYLRTDKFKN